MTWLEDEDPKIWDSIPPWFRAMARIFLRLALIGLVLAILVAVFYGVLAARYDIEEVVQMPERTLLLDRDGKELAAIHGVRRRVISREDVPQSLINALTTREDKDFYRHGGVHLRGVLRAAARNIADRKATQGASTITMQLARNTFEIREISLHRKLLEAAISFRIETNYSKDEIITAYLNRIYFGSGSYGIEQAAQSYFGKETSELTLSESALLVGIIRAPHDFSPRNDETAALRERDQVLKDMAADGMISFDERDQQLTAPLHLLPYRASQTDAIRCVRRHLNELLEKNDFATGGLTATSTIDRNLQQTARDSIDELIAPYPSLQCALVAIEPSTGAIRAVITARDPESSQYNRAFDTRRQLGPVFQPFLFAFSTERGRLPIPGQPIQTARQLPKGEIKRLSKRVGLLGPFTEGDELARGNLQTTPLEIATALTALSNEGKKMTTFFITELLDSQNELLFQQQLNHKLVLDPLSAETPFSLTKKKTWSSLNNPGSDLWTLHTDQHLSVALWLGFDDPIDLPDPEQLEIGASALASALARIAAAQNVEAKAELEARENRVR